MSKKCEEGFYNLIVRKPEDPKAIQEKAANFQQKFEGRFVRLIEKKEKVAKAYVEIIANPENFFAFEKILDNYRDIMREHKEHMAPEILQPGLAEQDLEDHIFELAISTYIRNKKQKQENERAEAEEESKMPEAA